MNLNLLDDRHDRLLNPKLVFLLKFIGEVLVSIATQCPTMCQFNKLRLWSRLIWTYRES